MGTTDERDTLRQRYVRGASRHHGGGARGERLGQEGEAIRLGTRHRREQEARPDGAAIGRDAGHVAGAETELEPGGRAGIRKVQTGQKIAQQHRRHAPLNRVEIHPSAGLYEYGIAATRRVHAVTAVKSG